MNNAALRRHAQKMRRLPDLLRQEVEKAASRNAKHFAEQLERAYADDPKLQGTVKAYPVTGTFETVWTVQVGDNEAFWARWREFGTAAGDRIYRRGPRKGTVMKHPGAGAIPTYFPTYRINARSYRSRLRSSVKRAARKLVAQK